MMTPLCWTRIGVGGFIIGAPPLGHLLAHRRLGRHVSRLDGADAAVIRGGIDLSAFSITSVYALRGSGSGAGRAAIIRVDPHAFAALGGDVAGSGRLNHRVLFVVY